MLILPIFLAKVCIFAPVAEKSNQKRDLFDEIFFNPVAVFNYEFGNVCMDKPGQRLTGRRK
jgi:hypothetical protein